MYYHVLSCIIMYYHEHFIILSFYMMYYHVILCALYYHVLFSTMLDMILSDIAIILLSVECEVIRNQ